MIWFTADTHFGHKNIIEYCNRPFASVEEMDETIINNINAVVKPEHTIYHLGDFSFGGTFHYRSKINCKNVHLILGNHDKLKMLEKRCFSTVSMIKEVRYAKQFIVLCHYGMRVWNKSHHGSWSLYGHSHGTLPPIQNSMDVGVDCHDYQPLSFDDVKEKI